MSLLEIEPEAAPAFPVEEIEAQLGRLLESHHFRHSQRYPALLRFLVERACGPSGPHIKERLIGIEVFHRAPDYDTNTDPVVRVTAAEVRKRIAQYYQEPEHTGELRIELPLGTYVPRFVRAPSFYAPVAELLEPETEAVPEISAEDPMLRGGAMPVEEPPQEAREASARPRPVAMWMVAVAAVCVGVLLTLAGLWVRDTVAGRQNRAVRSLWGPVANSGAPVLLVVGSHTVGAQGNALRAEQGSPASPSESVLRVMNEYEQIPISDVSSLLRLHAVLEQQHQRYRMQGAGAVDLAELQGGPVVLFGGFDNRWTMRLSQQLRFHFLDSPNNLVGTIVDAKAPGRRWQVDFGQAFSSMPTDYAVVARYFDPMIEEPVMMVAGIGAAGTAAASEFATSERMVEEMNRLRPKNGPHDNMELVLGVQVVDGKAGPPHVVASQFW